MSIQDTLIRPITALAVRCEALETSASIGVAGRRMLEEGLPFLPLLEDGNIIGVVRQQAIVTALAQGMDRNDPVAPLRSPTPPAIRASATGAVALRKFEEEQVDALIVMDANKRLFGVLLPAHLASAPEPTRLPRVGGMATPFGVYLTDGVHGAGAVGWHLAASGALMMTLHLIAGVITTQLLDFLNVGALSFGVQSFLLATLWSLLFLLGLRLLPLAGIHAAEHMTVHALERGEPLELGVVRRMPRVHPRCGTNLAAAALVFLGVSSAQWLPDTEIQSLVAAVIALGTWRPLGSALQKYFTTRPPSDAQIQMGIRAGQALVKKHESDPRTWAPLMSRLWTSGLPFVLAGAVGSTLLFVALAEWVPAFSFLKVYL